MTIVTSLWDKLKLTFRTLLNFITGLVSVIFIILFVIISLPVYFYRWVICSFVAPRYQPKLGQPLTPMGASYGAEFVSEDFHTRQSRSVMVTSSIFQGTIPFEAILEDLDRKWIKVEETTRDGEESTLRYPELQQYVKNWKGILFWKQEPNFELKDHVKLHKINEGCPDPEQFVCTLIQSLVNKPFPEKRSPWEIHIVHGYRNAKLFPSSNSHPQHNHDREDIDVDHAEGKQNDDNMTVFVFRLHHALADGFSVMSLEIEGLLGLSLDVKKPPPPPDSEERRNISPTQKVISCIQLPFRLIHDIGYLIGLEYHPQMSCPWNVPDEKKKWKQYYARAPLIPVEKISFIKRTFGVSFTSVLISGISAALSENLKGKEEAEKFKREVKFLPVSTALPLPRPQDERFKLRNYLTGTILELPIMPDLDPTERLQQCETCYDDAKHKLIPLFVQLYVSIFASHLSFVTNFAFKNRSISGGLSNMPGPTFPAYWIGKKLLNTDVTVGGLPGVAGFGVLTLSYGKHIRITVTAEKGVMSEKEVNQVIHRIYDEIDVLFGMAKDKDLPSAIKVSDDD